MKTSEIFHEKCFQSELFLWGIKSKKDGATKRVWVRTKKKSLCNFIWTTDIILSYKYIYANVCSWVMPFECHSNAIRKPFHRIIIMVKDVVKHSKWSAHSLNCKRRMRMRLAITSKRISKSLFGDTFFFEISIMRVFKRKKRRERWSWYSRLVTTCEYSSFPICLRNRKKCCWQSA